MAVNMTMEFKSCPRCKGDVHYDEDLYGKYKECFQCGYLVDIDNRPIIQNGRQPGDNPLLIDAGDNLEQALKRDETVELLSTLAGSEKALALRKLAPRAKFEEGKLEELLGNLINLGYVSISERLYKGKRQGSNVPSTSLYTITSTGREVVAEYTGLVEKVDAVQGANGSKSEQLSTYELVDEDGNITLFGMYAIKASKALYKFIDDMHLMAILSIDSAEITHEELPVRKGDK